MTASSSVQNTHRLVVRNTAILFVAQALGTPLSIVLSAVVARYLGPTDYGYIYLAGVLASFGFLLVDWGMIGTLPAKIARDRQQSGELLGSALVWRFGCALVVYALLAGGSALLNYGREFQLVLMLVTLQTLIMSMTSACQDAVRGFERMDVGAYGQVGQQFLMVLFVIPTLIIGGGLYGALAAQITAVSIVCVFVARALRPVGVGRLTPTLSTIKTLLKDGTPFFAFALAVALQPNIDAVLLSKLAPPEVVGWHAAARRLIGALVLPASMLVGALYPTLARLYKEDNAAYHEMTRVAIRTTGLLAIPIALGCALYRDIGIRIFSKEGFAAAQGNLLVLAPFLFLMYFTMPLGLALTAGNRQRAWAIVQCGCVVVSAALDPFLIPWFQERYGNGGLGVCVASVVSETLMLGAAAWLCRKTFDRATMKVLFKALVAGAAMAGAAYLLQGVNVFVAAPIAVAAYAGCLWAIGGVGPEQIAVLRDALARKAKR